MLDGPSIQIETLDQWRAWLVENAVDETAIWVVILKKSTGRQTVVFEALLEEAMCHGWVDVKVRRVDDEWYGIRFVPRRPNSNWNERNREIACDLIAAGRMKPLGQTKLPADLICPTSS